MSSGLTTTAANMIVLGLVAMGSSPALATNYHDHHPWSHPNNAAFVNYQPGHAGPMLAQRYLSVWAPVCSYPLNS
jgi:hypothetical protein